MDDFQTLADRPFRLGSREVTVSELLGNQAVLRIASQFSKIPHKKLETAARELLRSLYLAAYAPGSIFLPGNALMDDLWHSLILETAEYRDLCDRLRPGSFMHHKGISFSDYVGSRTAESMQEEECSWLASYVSNFGPIAEDSFEVLQTAQSLASRMNSNLAQLNEFALFILNASRNEAAKPFDFDGYLDQFVIPYAFEIDRSPDRVAKCVRDILAGIHEINPEAVALPSPEQHERLFSVSTTLAFTMGQHLSAVDRLTGQQTWQEKNPEFWREISSGRTLCGLATTNIAKPGGAGIQAKYEPNGFRLSGEAPWVCGYGIYDVVLIGFAVEKEVVFSIIEAPTRARPETMAGVTTILHDLNCLEGTATYRLQFHGKFIGEDTVVHRVIPKGHAIPRPSRYVIPEIGIAKRAIEATRLMVSHSTHPKHQIAARALAVLDERLKDIEAKRNAGENLNTLTLLRDDLTRDAIRLLGIAQGARSLEKGNLVSKLQLEFLLLDAVIQAVPVLEEKMMVTARGRVDPV